MPGRRHPSAPTRPEREPGAALTRRSALALGAAAGLGTLVRAPADGWAAGSAARSFSLAVPASAWSRGGGRATGTIAAPRRFDLLGLRGRGLVAARPEVRVRRRGAAWGPWTPLGVGIEHAPDAPRNPGGTDPVWAGGADELQLRARRAPAGVRIVFVAVPAAPRFSSRARAGGAGAAQAGGPPTIIPRAQWGGDRVPPKSAPSFGDVQLAFVHHTVSANGYSAEESAGIVLAIAKYHRDGNGWNDIGYNLLVDQYGQVFEGRAGGVEQAVIGAQAQGWNSHSTGIATIGTFSDVPFPEAGVASLARVLAWKLSVHGAPTTGTVEVVSAGGASNRYKAGVPVAFERISGHRDGCETACPGTLLYGQLPDLRARAAKLAGTVVGAPRLTLVPAAVDVAYGDPAAFSGQLLDGEGRALVGVPVSLQKLGSGGGYVTVARASTGSDGAWATAVPWKRGGAVRAIAKVPGGGAGVRSAPVSIAVATRLTVEPVRSRTLAGGTAALRGTIRPAAPVRVRLEREASPGRWVSAGEVAARSRDGRWSVAVPLRRPGLYRLRPVSGTRAAPVVGAQRFVRAVRSRASLGSGTNGRGGPSAGAGGAGAAAAPA